MPAALTIDSRAVAPGPAHRTELRISGMTCSGCARHVTEALQAVAGVDSAQVSLEEKRAAIRWKPAAEADVQALLEAVREAGYRAKTIATETPGEQSQPAEKESLWSSSMGLALASMILLMIGEWGFGLDGSLWFRWLSFGVAAVIQFGPGLNFYRGAWNQLKVRRANMDTLVALGSTTAFAYSTGAILTGLTGHLYFMEATAIIALVSTGHWAEARVSTRASSAVRALMNLAPTLARRRQADGTEEQVPVASLRPGDIVSLRPGDRIPVDGTVLEGASTVEESMLTGESLPLEKTDGSELYAGTVNLTGRLALKVTGTGDDTALAQIIATVRRAQTSHAAIQRLGDRVSSVFVPIVVVIAVATGLWWGLAPEQAHHLTDSLSPLLWSVHPPAAPLAAALITAAAVLIIACPCAMGLATPAAIMAGANAAARRGILIRDGIALETAGRVRAVLFDKTGTLTTGRPEVTAVETFGADAAGDKEFWISTAATLASHSIHPLSQAVARLTATRSATANWQEEQGSGVQATCLHQDREEQMRLGSLRWLENSGVDLTGAAAWSDRWGAEGASVLGLAQGNTLVLLIALRDVLKPNTREVVQQLQSMGLETYLLTGDHPRVAAAIAEQAGIPADHVFAQVRPEEKQAQVKKLQAQFGAVAFVGDGINDAPALEQADLGIAVTRASDIAREAADILLMRSDIEAVPESLRLAQATLRTIKQNLFWAFFYNALGIPLAALGFMSPVLCALAMGLSDLVVIGNALRLLRGTGRR